MGGGRENCVEASVKGLNLHCYAKNVFFLLDTCHYLVGFRFSFYFYWNGNSVGEN